jgi:hypothetical protein
MHVENLFYIYLWLGNNKKGIFIRGLRLESEHLTISLIQMLVFHPFIEAVVKFFRIRLYLNNLVEGASSGELFILAFLTFLILHTILTTLN